MKKTVLYLLLLVVTLLMIFSFKSYAGETALDLNVTLDQMIDAVQAQDYLRFIDKGDNTFKASLSKEMFEGVSGMMGARFQKGYTLNYLGSLNQQGCHVYLWKVVFNDQGDDVLIRMVVKNAKVAGFWFQ